MGIKDAVAKNFFGRRDVLAAILDYLLYDGMDVVRDSQLQEVNDAYYRIVQMPDGKFRTDNRYRDKLFEYTDGVNIMSVGLELQAHDDRHMVERVMVYDSRRFVQLKDEHRMHPIINIVLSFDRSRRSYPCRLSDMFIGDNLLASALSFDYGYISMNIYDMAEKTEMFPCTELQDVLYLFKTETNRDLFVDALTKGKCGGCLSRDAALVCAVFLGLDLKIDNDKDKIDMCKAWRDIKKDERKIGREQGFRHGRKTGIREGMAIGEANTLRNLVIRLLGQSRTLLDICDITGMSSETVEQIAAEVQV